MEKNKDSESESLFFSICDFCEDSAKSRLSDTRSESIIYQKALIDLSLHTKDTLSKMLLVDSCLMPYPIPNPDEIWSESIFRGLSFME